MEEMKIIRKGALAVFKDKKLLVVRDNKNAEVFYTVGGKVEPGESDIECVERETLEELGVEVVSDSLVFLQEFTAPAHGKENTLVNIQLFQGELAGEPHPSQEIVEIQYFDTTTDPKHLSEMGREHIMPWLKANGYIL